jgi:hypothetical protein
MDIDEMREAILAMQKQIDSLSRGAPRTGCLPATRSRLSTA